MKRILLSLLAAGTVAIGVAHGASAAEFIFRYRGMGPQVATAEPEEPTPTAARIVTAPFAWNKGTVGLKDGPAQAGDAVLISLVLPDPSSPGPNKTRNVMVYVPIPNPDAVSLADVVASITDTAPEAIASAEDGRLVLTTRDKGPDACVGLVILKQQEVVGYLAPADYPEFHWFDRSASTGLASVPTTCGTGG